MKNAFNDFIGNGVGYCLHLKIKSVGISYRVRLTVFLSNPQGKFLAIIFRGEERRGCHEMETLFGLASRRDLEGGRIRDACGRLTRKVGFTEQRFIEGRKQFAGLEL